MELIRVFAMVCNVFNPSECTQVLMVGPERPPQWSAQECAALNLRHVQSILADGEWVRQGLVPPTYVARSVTCIFVRGSDA